MLNDKATIILLIVGLIKKISLYKKSYFPEQYTHNTTKKKLNQICVIMQQKLTLKNATGVDKSNFGKKSDLSSLKSDVDKVDIVKLKNVRCVLEFEK